METRAGGGDTLARGWPGVAKYFVGSAVAWRVGTQNLGQGAEGYVAGEGASPQR